MCAALTARKRDHLSLRYVLPPLRSTEADPTAESDEQFLALKVVVEDNPVTGRDLVDAHPQVLGARLFSKPRAFVAGRLLEALLIDIRHDASLRVLMA